MQRFIGKKPYKKYVRPACNSKKPHKVAAVRKETKIIEEKIETEMNEKIEKIGKVLEPKKAPKRNVKVEKKEKGLFERTENSTILLTEDDKMLLND